MKQEKKEDCEHFEKVCKLDYLPCSLNLATCCPDFKKKRKFAFDENDYLVEVRERVNKRIR